MKSLIGKKAIMKRNERAWRNDHESDPSMKLLLIKRGDERR